MIFLLINIHQKDMTLLLIQEMSLYYLKLTFIMTVAQNFLKQLKRIEKLRAFWIKSLSLFGLQMEKDG